METELQMRQARAELENLVKSPGWERLVKAIAAQTKARDMQLRRQVTSLQDIAEQEFTKGEVAGLELFTKLPHITIEQLTAQIKLNEERENAPDRE